MLTYADVCSKAEAQWEDNDLTSQMWSIIKSNDLASMKALIDYAPNVVHARSSDGRSVLALAQPLC